MSRREFTSRSGRAFAHEFSQPKTLELENRVARLEIQLIELRRTYEEQRRTMAALKAEFDHLKARVNLVG